MEQKVKKFTVTISVTVDDASKYEDEMKKVCDQTFNELKAILRSMDRGTGRIKVEIQPVLPTE